MTPANGDDRRRPPRRCRARRQGRRTGETGAAETMVAVQEEDSDWSASCRRLAVRVGAALLELMEQPVSDDAGWRVLRLPGVPLDLPDAASGGLSDYILAGLCDELPGCTPGSSLPDYHPGTTTCRADEEESCSGQLPPKRRHAVRGARTLNGRNR